jgi:branched-subunit amino acid aminotransferase/4-amino-4-deoxychorismate lyase
MLACSINGIITSPKAAVISVEERGFLYGDGVFETIRIWRGIPVFFARHMNRLQKGLRAIEIASPTIDLQQAARELLLASPMPDGLLRIYVSRGQAGRGYLPHPDVAPLVVMSLHERIPPHASHRLWLSDIRKVSGDALPVSYKLAQGLNASLARMEAQKHRCTEALMLSSEGMVSELSGANLFWQNNGQIHTPSLTCDCLNGITRQIILEALGETVLEGAYPLAALLEADSAAATNSGAGVVAVAELMPATHRWNSAALSNHLQTLLENARQQDWETQCREWLVS